MRAAAKHLAGLIDNQAKVSVLTNRLTGLIDNQAKVNALANHLAGLIDNQARVSELASCLDGLIENHAQVQMRMCLNLTDKSFRFLRSDDTEITFNYTHEV